MMTTTHPLATAWLDRVRALSTGMPEDRRQELLADLRDHLDAALPPDPDAATVERVLARMGDPADVVAEAMHVIPTMTATPAARTTALPPPAPVLPSTRSTAVPNGWEVTSLTCWTAMERLAALAIPLTFVAAVALVVVLPLDGGREPEVACSEFQADGRFVEECTDTNGTSVDAERYPVGQGGPPSWTGWIVTGSLLGPPVASTIIIVWLVRRLRRRLLAPERQGSVA